MTQTKFVDLVDATNQRSAVRNTIKKQKKEHSCRSRQELSNGGTKTSVDINMTPVRHVQSLNYRLQLQNDWFLLSMSNYSYRQYAEED